MSVTLADLGTQALLDLGVLAVGQTPDPGQSVAILAGVNNLLDQFKSEDLVTYTVTRATGTLTASQTSFTVGTGGNINIPRPVYVDHVNYVDNSVSPAVEYDLGALLTDDQYAAIVQKSLTSARPVAAYYNPTYPTGTLIPWPISTGASLLWAVYYHAVVAEFAAITDTVALPPGYRRMLIKNLALELALSFTRDPSPLLVQQARESKAIVKRANARTSAQKFEAAANVGPGGMYDINSDTYVGYR